MGKLKEALSGIYRGKTLKDKLVAYANSGKIHARIENIEPEEMDTGYRMSYQDWNEYYQHLDEEKEKNGGIDKKQIEKEIAIIDQKHIDANSWLMPEDFYFEQFKAIKKMNLIDIINEKKAIVKDLEWQFGCEGERPRDIQYCAWLEHRIAYHKKLIIVFQKHAGFLERKVIVEKC